MVVSLRMTFQIGDNDAIGHATHFTNACIKPDPVCEGLSQPLDIIAAAADDGLPGRTLRQLQQAMIIVESG